MFKFPLKQSNPNDNETLEDLITSDTLYTNISSLKELVKKNTELRLKFQHDPSRFMESEERLYVAIKSFLSISTDISCLKKLNKSVDFFPILIALTSHENTDIVLAVIELFRDILDTSSTGDGSVDKEELEEAKIFAIKLTEHKLLDVLLRDVQGLEEELVQHVIYLVSDILDIYREANLQAWIPWLVLKFFERGTQHSKYLAAELIATLLLDEQYVASFIEADGIECTLAVLSAYKNRDPQEFEETEYMENAFDILCTLDDEGKGRFVEANGFDILVDLITALNVSRLHAVRLLSFLLDHHAASVHAFCSKGLGLAFSLFMQRDITKFKAKYPAHYNDSTERTDEGYIISIIAEICGVCTERARNKFEEPGKMDRLRELQDKYANDDYLSEKLVGISGILSLNTISTE